MHSDVAPPDATHQQLQNQPARMRDVYQPTIAIYPLCDICVADYGACKIKDADVMDVFEQQAELEGGRDWLGRHVER